MVRYFQSVPNYMYVPPVTHRNPCKWLLEKNLRLAFMFWLVLMEMPFPLLWELHVSLRNQPYWPGVFYFNWDDQITYSKPRVQHIKHVVSRQGGFATKCIQILDPCWGTSRILIIREHQAINYKISQYVPSVLNDYSIHSNYGNGQSYFDDFTTIQISSCI
jgi:hypothetical protein